MYKCNNNCGYISKKFFGICPDCNEGLAESFEGDANIVKQMKKSSSMSLNSIKKDVDYKIRKINKNIKDVNISRNTKYSSFDRVLSSEIGMVEDQVVVLGACPGVGKSTLCTEISSDDTLYISTEESYNQVNKRFLRVNPECDCDIVSTTDFESIIDIIKNTNKKFIILDSLNSINNGADGYVVQARNMTQITNIIKQLGKCAIIISQVSKSGEITGMQTISHACDTILYLERSLVSDNILLSSSKNRFGEIGSVAIFEHSKNGLVEVNNFNEEDIKSEIGKSYCNAKFGYRSMLVCVEALVAPSSLNVGIKKVNGLNLSRVQQILGILSYNSNINFTNKDVYVSVSHGLSVNDVKLDLSIANSILSSYFQVENKLKVLNGEISLNGTIKGNEKLSHIKDLISIYSGR